MVCAASPASQLPFGWVCFSNPHYGRSKTSTCRRSQLPFGWVCFSNIETADVIDVIGGERLNCLSAGSVSLTSASREPIAPMPTSQLPFGWVCFSNKAAEEQLEAINALPSQLPFGWVCFSNVLLRTLLGVLNERRLNCLSAGSVSLT